MPFSLYNMFEAALLVVNGIAVLNEERFLSKLGSGQEHLRGFGEDPGTKQQLISLVRSVRTVMRIPLIFLNILTILFKLILG